MYITVYILYIVIRAPLKSMKHSFHVINEEYSQTKIILTLQRLLLSAMRDLPSPDSKEFDVGHTGRTDVGKLLL